jgi:tuberculosinol/isotuberculosinol synthase
MDLQTFLTLPTEEVAAIVRASGSKVCVFPINGTRRWFTLEYGDQEWDDPIAAYMDITAKRHIELYKLFFDHGIDTLITPVIGPEILATRNSYMQKIGATGLARIATNSEFLTFYEQYGVRAHFYGDYRKHLANTSYEHLSAIFDGLIETTCQNNRFRLFFGAFADNLSATQVVAELAVQYFQKHGIVPDQKKIVEMYYGEYVEKANIFIGFDRFAVFDYPLINWGEEDLYFTVAPSLYLDIEQLRTILYDHINTRRTLEPEYDNLPPERLKWLKNYYRLNQKTTLGTGIIENGIWLPTKNINWPDEISKNEPL